MTSYTGQKEMTWNPWIGGNDCIFGNGGNDVIDGGDGDDTIHGGFGDDTIKVSMVMIL